MIALLALHALVGMVVVAAGGWLGRRCLWLALVPPVVTCAWLASQAGAVLDGSVVGQTVSWVPELGIALSFRLDGFGLLMAALVSGIGTCVVVYAAGYLSHWRHEHARLVGLLTLFAGSMLGLVLSDDLLVLFTCWELTSITSYLLIGNDHENPQARAGALHALLVTGAGGLVMLAGFLLIGQAGGTYRISELLADPPGGTSVEVGLVLLAVGALTKSAQYPFHSWLPNAMVAPTPVSAYLHSATMVKAGVYLVARFSPAFGSAGPWRTLILVSAGLSMFAGGLRAVRQVDLKRLLAFGTVSQLGFMLVVFAVGTPEALVGGVVLILAHALFKAPLFMAVGAVDHQAGTRKIGEIPPLGRGWAPQGAVVVASVASMAGLPLMLGFVSKEIDYEALLEGSPSWPATAVVVAGSVMTVAYGARLVWGLLIWPRRRPPGKGDGRPAPGGSGPATAAVVRPPGPALLVPGVVLTALTVLTGLVPALLDGLAERAARALGQAEDVHLAVWHGVNEALLLSAATLSAGALLFALNRPVELVLSAVPKPPTGSEVYRRILRGLNEVADRVTAVVQSGSLPVYAGVILLTVAVAPAVALVGASWPGWPDLVETPAHVPIALAIVGAALTAALVRRRIAAALFLGATGYGMAGLFVVQGAPDLALTTVAIESLSTVLFVLVLRRLPRHFEQRSTPRFRVVRLVVAGTVGAVVFAFALLAAAERPTGDTVSDEMVERALPDGHGRNIVNVILVDFRAFDTMGEITVLAAASIGAVALARADRRPRPRPSADGSTGGAP
ncbi:MAG: hydrogen gas-evolving membrane-bound hydrogenase subunit E [Acidimicrobiia bacterium]